MVDSKKILVVEDNKSNMKLAAILLKHNGYSVFEAYSGEEALKILSEEIPDLILLDLQLPKMSGFEVFDKIKENSKLQHIKVIAFTASFLGQMEKIKKYGFDDLILKPFKIHDFVKQVRENLEVQ